MDMPVPPISKPTSPLEVRAVITFGEQYFNFCISHKKYALAASALIAGYIAKGVFAEKLEEIYLPNQEETILLDRKSPALHLIQRIRDEAHRFGITHHRNLRQKASVHSTLEDIPGIGKTRRRALLTHFKSIKRIAEASIEELQEAEGIGPAQAKVIYAHYHKDDTENKEA